MKKTAEELKKDKEQLTNAINALLRKFTDENPGLGLRVDVFSLEITTQCQTVRTYNAEIDILI